MTASTEVRRTLVRVAVLAAALVPAVRAEDDVVREEPTPSPARAPAFGGQFQGGRVIIMPGLRLQVGGQGQLQVQGGNVRAPAANAAPAGEARKEAYLGVVAGLVPPPVRAQLDLADGVGLTIEAVAAGGPAEKAGVRQFDVIHKFNDQVVCSPEQLTTLVKVAGAGTKVPLTLVRRGHEKVVEAVLEEHEVVEGGEGQAVAGALPGVLNLQALPNGLPPGLDPADVERKVAEALARAGAGGGLLPGLVPGMVPGMPGVVPGVQGNVRAQVLTIGPNAQSATVVSDARGTVEVRSAGGKKTVTVKDPDGKEVHSGPLDTDEDLAKVPEEFRDWVREVGGGQAVVEPLAPEAVEPETEPGAAADAGSGPTI
ncbi:MAG: PDZ domain-containing protein [Planctomycetaceae bacterium]